VTVAPQPALAAATPDVLVLTITGPAGAPQRRALAKAITLIESTRADHRLQADALLTAVLPHTGKALRLGLSGVPGVGKSTFVEMLGLQLIQQGHRVAVLAVDPSSSLSGGSILGDKTRMEHLSVHPQAFIRPSPAAGNLGGVAEKTREAVLLCEAAGYSVVIIETVGVGQSEVAVAGMTDCFVLLQLPNAGDDLQALKKGVMELADLVVVNKADLDSTAALRAQAQLSGALRFVNHQHHTSTPVLQTSALKGTGLAEFWQAVQQFDGAQKASGQQAQRRRQQDQAWMAERISAGLRQRFDSHAAVQAALPQLQASVLAGRVAPSVAARQLLNLFDPPDLPKLPT
jgi:LAO/AO transport system kinase